MKRTVIYSSVAAVSLFIGTYVYQRPYVDHATVVRIVDGDTLVIRQQNEHMTVRLIGVDTPETKHPTKGIECFGPEASQTLAMLAPVGSRVTLTYDQNRYDRYGRVLAYVATLDGVQINERLLIEGAARPLAIRPNVSRASRYDALAHEAQNAGRGLWSKCR